MRRHRRVRAQHLSMPLEHRTMRELARLVHVRVSTGLRVLARACGVRATARSPAHAQAHTLVREQDQHE